MDYIIRKVQTGDEGHLAYIQTESWKAAFKDILPKEILEKTTELNRATSMYKQLIDECIGNGYILEVNGAPHCIAWWDKARDDDMTDYAELISIHSLQDNWGKGYGTKMIEQVIEDIKDVGYTKIMLWVLVDNERARKFYESIGFITYGKTKPCFQTQEICYERYIEI